MAYSAEELLSYRRLLKSRSRWRLITLVVILLSIIGLFISFSDGEQNGSDHIARIHIQDVITTDERRAALLQDIRDDDAIKAVVLRINSPGGTTAGSESLYEYVRYVAEKKPVIAVIDEMAASGGYIAALSADYIISRETSIVGSIGVLIQWGEVGGLLDHVGVKLNSVKSDPLKAEPDISKPISAESEAVLKKVVDDSHQWFLKLVETSRGLDTASASTLGDGRIFSGKEALEHKLIDAIGGEMKALSYLKENHNLENLEIENYKPSQENKLQDLFAGNISIIQILSQAIGVENTQLYKFNGILALWKHN